MLIDQQVWFGICVGNSPLMGAEVRVKGPNQAVNQEVLAAWNKIWSTCASKMLRTKYYGYTGSEVTYKLSRGYLEVADILDRHPRDTTPLVWQGNVIGIAVRGMRGKDTNPKAEPLCLKGMKGLWLTYDAEYCSRFGRPILERAYGPWYDKATTGGAYDLRRLRCMKDAWIGDIGRYPLNWVGTLPNGQTLTGKDVMREITENRSAGGTIVLPSDVDPATGKYLFDYQAPQTVAPSDVVQRWITDLDWDIFDGLLLPREVVEASATGSGFSGRSIPLVMFLGTRDIEFSAYVRETDKQVIRPMVVWNHGMQEALEYEIEAVTLLETVTKQIGGSDLGGGALGGGGPDGGGDRPPGGDKSRSFGGFAPGSDTDGRQGDTDGRGKGEQFSTLSTDVLSVQLNLAFAEAMKVLSLGSWIADDLLAENGREDDPHITVKWGIDGDLAERAAYVLESFGPIPVRILGASVFESTEHDVVKLDVEGERLRELNALLAQLPNVDSHPDYVPHITVAYVKTGAGQAIADAINKAGGLDGTDLLFVEAKISRKGLAPEWVRLDRQPMAIEAASIAPAPVAQFSVADPPGNRSRDKNQIIDRALDVSGSVPGEIRRRLNVLLKKN